MWFESLMGFREESPEQVQSLIEVSDCTLTSLANGKTYTCGRLETPMLAELRERAAALALNGSGRLTVSERVADVQQLHCDRENAGALFQVASQFNLLEMTSPNVTPEAGVDGYEWDRTQGPACAIAAGAGTIFRNYFFEVNGKQGQTSGNQIDCAAELGNALGNDHNKLWNMQNGYLLPTPDGLEEICRMLSKLDDTERNRLRGLLRVGIQWNTEVTIGDSHQLVTQVYCSALPVAYSHFSQDQWKDFACLVLEAAYEATICAALLNFASTGNPRVFLTLLGGGAFGNSFDWILGAIERALRLYRDCPLEVEIVSYGSSKPCVRDLVAEFV